MHKTDRNHAAGTGSRRLFFYNGGFLRQPRLRRILALAGYDLRLGLPRPGDGVAVWGRSPYAARGEAVAAKRGAGLVRLEDAFLRSVRPGRMGDAPLGLLIDPMGVHFDSATPSRIEQLLATAPLDDTNILQQARDGIARLQALVLSKYNNFDETLLPPSPGYVLVVDQTLGDASIRHGGATAATFREMLAYAQIENPGARIVIKTHPETMLGLRGGHFDDRHGDARTMLLRDPISPWALLEGAIAVYTVSSQLGYEAILAGHKPRVFGQPFYAGWGLTVDQSPVARRQRTLTRAQIFAVSHILAPLWYDPCRDRLCSFSEVVDQLEAEVRSYRADRVGHVALGMRLWKRGALQKVFGRERPLVFARDAAGAVAKARATGRGILVWAGKETPDLAAQAQGIAVVRVEDGFVRSRGLGADLVAALSLVTDQRGIYYDPARPSDLEALIAAPPLPGGKLRAERLLATIRRAGLSKYNLRNPALLILPEGRRILVPGQVEDDASIRCGGGKVCTNLAFLAQVRAENPAAIIIFKPHPDVEAGLRPGRIDPQSAGLYADVVAAHADPVAQIDAVDEVWTMTSLLGFEALVRGKRVTCLGAPFYAGWGLTHDLGPKVARRSARPDLLQLTHAALIAYPRYFDPISGRPCPPEVVMERLETGYVGRAGVMNRVLAKAQGIMASFAPLWR
ncbi:capsular polysaccharide biosynthesis protein [Phaeovulum sp.]|uniref:capsular polysaccharide biosynthesis protein n=1 Tax=Phaeovulum sp. TaxID=2934796 RepID=UPI0039E3A93C